MKKIVFLTTFVIFVLAGMAFAQTEQTVTASTQGKLIANTTTEYTVMDAFGNTTYGKRTSFTKTQTTRNDGKTSVTTSTESTSVVLSSWRGGSLKADTVTEDSSTKNNNSGAVLGTSHFNGTYGYNNNAYISSATGKTVSNETDPESKQVTDTTTNNTYTIKDGQALVSSAKTTGTIKSGDGTNSVLQNLVVDSTNAYAYKGGSMQITGSTSNSTYTGQNSEAGTSTNTLRKTGYVYDAKGINTGLTMEMSGTRVIKNGLEGHLTQKIVNWDKNPNGKSYKVAYDAQMGRYISNTTTQWDLGGGTTTPPSLVTMPNVTGPASANANIEMQFALGSDLDKAQLSDFRAWVTINGDAGTDWDLDPGMISDDGKTIKMTFDSQFVGKTLAIQFYGIDQNGTKTNVANAVTIQVL